MEIRLFKLNKRNNSTKRPSGSGDSYNCYLKDSTSVVDPSVIMEYRDHTSYYDYNYAYIPDFDRYYYISDIISSGKTWELTLVTDVLATYKDEIGNSNMYVLRSARAWDGRIVDNYYPLMTYHTSGYTQGITPWLHGSAGDENVDVRTGGCFVIGVVAKPTASGAGSYGSVTYYVIEQSSLRILITKLLSDTVTSDNGFSSGDMQLALQKALVDPLQFIKSCMWFPLSYAQIDGSADMHEINIWDWTVTDSGFTCKILTKNPPYSVFNVVNTIHKHPWANARGEYMNTAPYTKMRYTVPPFGMFDIDTALCSDASQIRGQIILDYITGLGTLDIIADTVSMHRIKSQVGVPIQLSQVTYDYLGSLSGAVSGAASTIGGLLSLNPGAVMNGVQSMIGSAVNAFIPNQSSIGGNGGFSELRGKANLYYEHYFPVDEDLQNAGRPLCEMRVLSSLPGYQLIMDGDVQISGTAGEQAAVKSFLEGGYYYE